MFHKETLSNGLRVLTVPMPGIESVCILVLIGAGSRYETAKTKGLAHFMEHIFFKGTKKRPRQQQIAEAIEGIGGKINGFTDKEMTGYWVKVPKNQLEKGLELLADLLQYPLMRPKDIEQEKNVILEEIKMHHENPMIHIWELFEKVIYGDQPLGWDTAGEPTTIQNMNQQILEKYLENLYTPDNILVVVVGNFVKEKIKFLAEKHFHFMNSKKLVNFEPVKELQNKPELLVENRKVEQAQVTFGFRAYPDEHPDKYVSKVLNTILAVGMSSRLFSQIREKRGLAYTVRGHSQTYVDTGYLVVYMGVAPDKISETIKVTLNEVAKLSKIPVPAKELNKGKEFLKGQIVLDMEDSFNLATLYGVPEILNEKVRTLDEILAQIDKVTEEDVLRVAQDLFVDKKLNLAVIGPIKNENSIKRLLKI